MIGSEPGRRVRSTSTWHPSSVDDLGDGRVGTATVRGTTVRYWRSERPGAETVLLLHGLGGDRRGLAGLAARLPGVNVVLPDLPGYGESPPLPVPHTLANYAHAVDDLRAELGLGRCHVLGHSLGASIALVHAALYPATLASLTLLNPVSTANGATASLGKLYYRIAAWLPERVARFWLASRPAVYVADAFVIVTDDRAVRRRILREDYENYRRASVSAMVESFLSYYDTPFAEHAGAVSVPTLLVAGDRDGIAPAGSVTELAARIGDGRLELVRGGGHLLPMERPAEAAGLVGDFLAGIASTVD